MESKPIVAIDDDDDDLELIENALKALDVKNKIICFNKSVKALEYLQTSSDQPFFILCDVHMPVIDGLALRKKIYEDEKLLVKSIPFLFLSTSKSDQFVKKAYSLYVQGYFKKPDDFEILKELLKNIITYWKNSYRPAI